LAFELETVTEEAAEEIKKQPVPSHAPTWGCLVMVKVYGGTKCEVQATPHVYLGRSDSFSGSLVECLQTGRIFVTKNTHFEKDTFPCRERRFDAQTAKMRGKANEGLPNDTREEFKTASNAIATIGGVESGAWSAPTYSTFNSVENDMKRVIDSQQESSVDPSLGGQNAGIFVEEVSGQRSRGLSQKALDNIVSEQIFVTQFSDLDLSPRKETIYPWSDPHDEKASAATKQAVQWQDSRDTEIAMLHSKQS
jgi:hypothetical protein